MEVNAGRRARLPRPAEEIAALHRFPWLDGPGREVAVARREVRIVLHLDLDAFFCAVEETRNPELRGKAFAVGGRPEERGVVASCSYAARRDGVRSAMPMGKALGLSPRLIIVPSRHHL